MDGKRSVLSAERRGWEGAACPVSLWSSLRAGEGGRLLGSGWLGLGRVCIPISHADIEGAKTAVGVHCVRSRCGLPVRRTKPWLPCLVTTSRTSNKYK